MKVVGIVCEYNPFHSGHKYLIDNARNAGADYIIAIMSGNYVQRGVPAFMDKYTRSEIALKMGVDIVVELPVVYSTASSEVFASSAIAIMDKLGIVTDIAFGVECSDIKLLNLLGRLLAVEPEAYKINLKAALKEGNSYAFSKYSCLTEYITSSSPEEISRYSGLDLEEINQILKSYSKEDLEKAVNSPNNNLGIEYLKAIYLRKSSIKPIIFKRIENDYHESDKSGASYSATALRNSIMAEDFSTINDDFLKETYINKHNHGFPVIPDDFSLILGEKLIKSNSFEHYYGITNSLSNRIANNVYNYKSFTEFNEMLKTKEISYTAISRGLLHIALNILSEDVLRYISEDYCDYVKILGFSKKGTSLLSKIQVSIYTVINSARDEENISESFKGLYNIGLYADNLYRMVQMNKFNYVENNEYTRKCLIV